jgi:hypothetical protein
MKKSVSKYTTLYITVIMYIAVAMVVTDVAFGAPNPPTNYTLQQWYCEDVMHSADKACNATGLFTSISSLPNLSSATSLTQVGTLTTGGASGSGFTLNAGTIAWLGAIPQTNMPPCYSTGIVPISCGGNGTAVPSITTVAGIGISGSWPNYTFSLQSGAANTTLPSNPTGTHSTTAVMMGLGSSLTFTPSRTGNVLLHITGVMSINNAANSCTAILRYGSGTAPANGVAASGTALSATVTVFMPNNNGPEMPTALVAVASGLTVGTAYWYDLAMSSVTGSTTTCSMVAITGSAAEL